MPLPCQFSHRTLLCQPEGQMGRAIPWRNCGFGRAIMRGAKARTTVRHRASAFAGRTEIAEFMFHPGNAPFACLARLSFSVGSRRRSTR